MAAFFNPNNIPKKELLRFTGSFVLSVRRPLPRPEVKGIPIPEFVKFLLVESIILGFGIRNTAEGIRNSNGDWNPESKFP